MIASVTGVLAARDGDTIVVQTDGGVGYEVTVPAGVAGRLPAGGGRVSLHTELVVKEDGWALYGFDRAAERGIFQRLLGASGFGPSSRMALLSALGPERTVRSILGARPARAQQRARHRTKEGGAAGARAARPLRRRDPRIGAGPGAGGR